VNTSCVCFPCFWLLASIYLRSMSEVVDLNNNDDPQDSLVYLAGDFPNEVIHFLQATISIGISFGFVPLVCILGVVRNLTHDGCCNRPLWTWLCIHCGLQLLQLPLRTCVMHCLHKARLQETDTVMRESIEWLTTSLPWKLNKIVSFLAYGWLVLGVVWVLHAGSCQLSSVCMFLIVVAGAKFLLTWVLFQYLIPAPQQQEEEHPEELDDLQHQGASWELIDSMPIVTHVLVDSDVAQDTCVVCLSDFDDGQSLRRLPCCHMFHQGCIDEWLSRRKSCPLCLQDVESTPQSSRISQREKKDA